MIQGSGNSRYKVSLSEQERFKTCIPFPPLDHAFYSLQYEICFSALGAGRQSEMHRTSVPVARKCYFLPVLAKHGVCLPYQRQPFSSALQKWFCQQYCMVSAMVEEGPFLKCYLEWDREIPGNLSQNLFLYVALRKLIPVCGIKEKVVQWCLNRQSLSSATTAASLCCYVCLPMCSKNICIRVETSG